MILEDLDNFYIGIVNNYSECINLKYAVNLSSTH
jgi:hypothetical protein